MIERRAEFIYTPWEGHGSMKVKSNRIPRTRTPWNIHGTIVFLRISFWTEVKGNGTSVYTAAGTIYSAELFKYQDYRFPRGIDTP